MWKRSRIREEELNGILSNGELDETAKAEAIKALVGKSFVPTSKYNEEKTKNTQLAKDFETFKQSKMTDEEKTAETLRKQQEEFKATKMQLNRMTAENVFTKAGFQESDYKDILDKIVGEDTKITDGLAQAICTSMLNQKAEIEKKMAEKIAKGTPKPDAGESGDVGKTEVENIKQLYNDAVKRNDFVKMAYYTRLLQEKNKK